ncbi:MAG: hypothetical protein ACTSYI_01665 [Promethearchaeota archaeon]
MKLKYPAPQLLKADLKTLRQYPRSVAMVAVDAEKNLIIVNEIENPSLWTAFWKQIQAGNDLNSIVLTKDMAEDSCSISWLGDQIVKGLNYVMGKGYIFLGILIFDNEVLDQQIIDDWTFFKRKKQYFINILKNYFDSEYFPKFHDRSMIDLEFIGTGEKFFSMSQMNLGQIAQMTSYFSGELHGIAGFKNTTMDLMIISQNIAKKSEDIPLALNKRGRDTVIDLIKSREIIPIAGFQFIYGIDALRQIKCGEASLWNSMEMIPKYAKPIKLYNNYVQALIYDKPSPVEPINFPSPFSTVIPSVYNQEVKKLSVEEMLKDLKPIETESPSSITQILDENTEVKLKKPSIAPLKISLPPLKKISPISPNHPVDAEISVEDGSEQVYEDVFEKQKEKVQLFDEDGKMIVDPNQIDYVLDKYSSEFSNDINFEVNPKKMTKDEMLKDLEESISAISQLDRLALEDQAISRIYYPPPSLISKATKEGMIIGGSTVILSAGTGWNLFMVPEIKYTQMWGKFYEESDLSDQLEDFVALRDKEIDSGEEYENLLQNAFVRIKGNNHIFLGLCDLEGNGFERNVFDPELMLDNQEIQKLMGIHQQKRENMQFPVLENEQWIEIRYYGKPETIKLLTNPHSNSTLEIANDIRDNTIYAKGVIAGIVCLDQDGAYFFILSDNLQTINEEESQFQIDFETLNRMHNMIDEMGLSPASWWRISFGFKSFESYFQWDEIKDGVVFPIIKDNYEKYVLKLLETKLNEDRIRDSLEKRFPQ